jgi:hypothetical protein
MRGRSRLGGSLDEVEMIKVEVVALFLYKLDGSGVGSSESEGFV